jgi:hypothetical protein
MASLREAIMNLPYGSVTRDTIISSVANESVFICDQLDWEKIGFYWMKMFRNIVLSKLMPLDTATTFILYHFGESVPKDIFLKELTWVRTYNITFSNFLN